MSRALVYMNQIAANSADGFEDELRGESAPDEPSYQVQARRMGPFGLRSRPPAGVDAVAVADSPSNWVIVGAESAEYGPSDLDDGETAVYDSGGALIRVNATGAAGTAAVNITVPSGYEIHLNGTDAVIKGGSFDAAFQTFLGALNTYVTGIKTVADPSNLYTPAMLAAITAMQAASTNALSAVTKTG